MDTIATLIISFVTITAALLSFFIAVRTELRKNTENIIGAKMIEEKRHSNHEKRLAIIEQRLQNMENSIESRLEIIDRRLSEIYDLFIEHIKERHL